MADMCCEVCLLTGLRDLTLSAPGAFAAKAVGLLLQLAQLQHLTSLVYNGPLSNGDRMLPRLDAEVSWVSYR
jgi:hypothetical protein